MNSSTLIVILFLIVIIGMTFAGFIKRFFSKQTCCGTEKVRRKRKKLKNVAGSVVFHVDGMHCNHCKASVEEAVNKLDGLAGKVSLEKKTLEVLFEDGVTVDCDAVISTLGELGFIGRLKG